MAVSVDIWIADVTEIGDGPARLLDAEERARAAAFLSRPARELFVVSRALQRALGARYLGIRPDEVRIGRRCAHCDDPGHGRPYLIGGRDLDFSVSHSGTLVMVGYATGARVGVDLERVERRTDVAALHDQVLSPAERVSVAGLTGEAAQRAFLTLWTRKEAVLKLTGHGLIVPLTSVTVLEPVAAVAPEPAGWPDGPITVSDLALPDGYVGALACTATGPTVTVRRAEELVR